MGSESGCFSFIRVKAKDWCSRQWGGDVEEGILMI